MLNLFAENATSSLSPQLSNLYFPCISLQVITLDALTAINYLGLKQHGILTNNNNIYQNITKQKNCLSKQFFIMSFRCQHQKH